MKGQKEHTEPTWPPSIEMIMTLKCWKMKMLTTKFNLYGKTKFLHSYGKNINK